MRILISNDDGYQAKGIKQLAESLSEIAEIIMQKGTLNLTTDQRRKMIENKRKQIVAPGLDRQAVPTSVYFRVIYGYFCIFLYIFMYFYVLFGIIGCFREL